MASDMVERERLYDEEIAPALLDLAKRCNEAGLSFLACVEWEPGETGRTAFFQAEHGFPIEIANAAIIAGNNVDSLIMHLVRKARETGHSSAFLHQLGVPLKPALQETNHAG